MYNKKYYPPQRPKETDLSPVNVYPSPKVVYKTPANLSEQIDYLELAGGNLITFLAVYRGVEPKEYESVLFDLYKDLNKPENKVLKDRWDLAISRSNQLRLKLLQCRALHLLENFSNPSDKSPSPIVAYSNLLLSDILASAKGLPIGQAPQISDEQDDMDKDLEMLEKEPA